MIENYYGIQWKNIKIKATMPPRKTVPLSCEKIKTILKGKAVCRVYIGSVGFLEYITGVSCNGGKVKVRSSASDY